MPTNRRMFVLFLFATLAVSRVASADQGSSTLPAAGGSSAPAEASDGASDATSDEDMTTLMASVKMDMTVASRYLFQGIDYSDGKTVLQPNLSLVNQRFTANAWGNYQADLRQLTEVDVSLKYELPTTRVSSSVGYMYLRYPGRFIPSQELFMDLSSPVPLPLSPTLSIHYDIDAGKGAYTTLGLTQNVAPMLSLGANVFYQTHYYEMTGCPAIELKANASVPLGFFTITPSLSRFVTFGNGDFRDGFAIPSNWLFSLNVAR